MLKDWKKIGIRDDEEGFWVKYRNEEKKQEIHIANIGYNFKRGYYVHLYLNTSSSTKQFKTKAQALAYAKSYMRKN